MKTLIRFTLAGLALLLTTLSPLTAQAEDGTWLTSTGGCRLFDPAKKIPADLKISWSGTCQNGLAEGSGNFEGTWGSGRWIRGEAGFRNGRRHGTWKLVSSTGSRNFRTYKDGVLHGAAARIFPNGTYGEYIYVNGQKRIRWLVAYLYPDNSWCTGPCKSKGPSDKYVMIVQATGKDPVTQPCGSNARACRDSLRKVRSAMLEKMANKK